MNLTLDLLLTLLGIGQVITGAISWYFGVQVKMLRLELVSRETCHERHERLVQAVGELRTDLECLKHERLKSEHHGANNA